jgi:hypothetical protein
MARPVETQSITQVQHQYLRDFAKHQRSLEAVADSIETQVDKIRTCIWRVVGPPITGAHSDSTVDVLPSHRLSPNYRNLR